MEPRRALVDRLQAGRHPDIVIVGGGCNGAGLFRDLALQGVASLLVEKGDFSSGTSAAPTRLAHGGLKYLETGEISLVRESTEERNLLLFNAPHQVRPLPIWVPLRSWLGGALLAPLRFGRLTKRPGPKGYLAVKAGLTVYDRFGNIHRTLPRHRVLSRAAALQIVHQLNPNIRAVAQYHDSLMTQPERLVMEMIGDGERDCQEAMAIPYFEAMGCKDGVLELRDTITGNVATVAPRLVINMAGAWADEVQAALGFTGRMVGGTKGSHVVVRNQELADALDGRMLYFEADDFRACIVLHLGGDRLFLGATDLRCDDPEDKCCSDEEIDYILDVTKTVVPDVALSRDDIVYAVAGVRPLPRTEGVEPGLISRDHKLHEFPVTEGRPFPVLTLIGGKWTTYRACAEQVTDAVLRHLGAPRLASTRTVAIGGGRDFPRSDDAQAAWARDCSAETGVTVERAAALAWRYGSTAKAIAEAETAAGSEPAFAGYSAAEIAWIVENERVTRLEDIVKRRTLLAFEGRITRDLLEAIADVVTPLLRWDPARRMVEVSATAKVLTERHRMKLEAQ